MEDKEIKGFVEDEIGLLNQDSIIDISLSLPNIIHKEQIYKGSTLEEAPESPPLLLYWFTRIRKSNYIMLKHLICYFAIVDSSATNMFIEQLIPKFILAVLAKGLLLEVKLLSTLTLKDKDYIPTSWIDIINCIKREK